MAYLTTGKTKSMYLSFYYYFLASIWKNNFHHTCWNCKEEKLPVFYKPVVHVGLPCLFQKTRLEETLKGSHVASQHVTNLQ